MPHPRNNTLIAALVTALACLPVLPVPPAAAAAQSGPDPVPLTSLAVVPATARLTRQRRYATVRTRRSWLRWRATPTGERLPWRGGRALHWASCMPVAHRARGNATRVSGTGRPCAAPSACPATRERPTPVRRWQPRRRRRPALELG